jgi:hypothetical protein
MLLTVTYQITNKGLLSDRLIWAIKQLIKVQDAALELEQWVRWRAFQSRLVGDNWRDILNFN